MAVRAKRLQVALAASQHAYEDASQSPPRRTISPSKEHASVADFCASPGGDDSEDELDAKLREAQAPIEQLMARNRQLEQRAERALQGSLESRSLLREVEGLLRAAEIRADAAAEVDDEGSSERRGAAESADRPASGVMSAREARRPTYGAVPGAALRPSLQAGSSALRLSLAAGRNSGGGAERRAAPFVRASSAELSARPTSARLTATADASGVDASSGISGSCSSSSQQSPPTWDDDLSPADAVKAMRLERCNELNVGLQLQRHSLSLHAEQLAEATQVTLTPRAAARGCGRGQRG